MKTIFKCNFLYFKSTPPANEDLANPEFPDQAFGQAIQVTITSNPDGTFSHSIKGLDGSHTDTNGQKHDYADYYIVYQEVNYSTDPVTVKSAEITKKFTIKQPSKITLTISEEIQPECAV